MNARHENDAGATRKGQQGKVAWNGGCVRKSQPEHRRIEGLQERPDEAEPSQPTRRPTCLAKSPAEACKESDLEDVAERLVPDVPESEQRNDVAARRGQRDQCRVQRKGGQVEGCVGEDEVETELRRCFGPRRVLRDADEENAVLSLDFPKAVLEA